MNSRKAVIPFHEKESANEYVEETIQTSFLIPIREDKDFGTGQLHPNWKWDDLENELCEKYGGFTKSNNLYPGEWINPKSKMRIGDISRKYFVETKGA